MPRIAVSRPNNPEAFDRTDYAKNQVARQHSLGKMELRVPLANGYRTAVVEVRSARVRLNPDAKKRRGRKTLKLGLIEVREISTPLRARRRRTGGVDDVAGADSSKSRKS